MNWASTHISIVACNHQECRINLRTALFHNCVIGRVTVSMSIKSKSASWVSFPTKSVGYCSARPNLNHASDHNPISSSWMIFELSNGPRTPGEALNNDRLSHSVESNLTYTRVDSLWPTLAQENVQLESRVGVSGSAHVFFKHCPKTNFKLRNLSLSQSI